MVPIFVITPLVCAFSIPILAKFRQRLAFFCAAVGSLVLLVFSLMSFSWIASGATLYYVGGWKPPFGICMVLDSFSALLLLVVNLIGFLSVIYSMGYINNRYTGENLYYTLFSLLLAGLNGVVISGDLFNLFVFLEITSIASYALVAFGTEAEQLEAAFKYLVLGSIASAMILLGIGLLLGSVSTLNMADISRSLANSSARNLIHYSLALFIMGFGLKMALVPFHAWLPDAHPAAPAPMSAMLSGVVIKTTGVYALTRIIFNVYGFTGNISSLLVLLGIISMLVGVLLAIGQWDFKRLLAYSSISQVGYVIFGLGLGTPLGIAGGLFHLFHHSLVKSCLFLNAGAVDYATGSSDLRKLGNLNRSMSLTAASSLISSLSISGIPPFSGFWSKLLIIIAAFQAKNFVGGLVCILVSVITLALFLKVQKYVFMRNVDEGPKDIKEVPSSMLLPMLTLAFLCLVVGLFFIYFLHKLIYPASEVLLNGLGYSHMVLGS